MSCAKPSAAQSLNVRLQFVEIRGSGDLDDAFRAVTDAGRDALYVVSSRQTVLNIPRIVDFATRKRLPLAGGWGAWGRAGGLLSYGPNINDMMRGVVAYLDKILKGAKPADLPVQQPTKFESRADEVIE
jgi:putative ABC transport system substrate-binding protein